jgi:hypothetical protein
MWLRLSHGGIVFKSFPCSGVRGALADLALEAPRRLCARNRERRDAPGYEYAGAWINIGPGRGATLVLTPFSEP